MPNYLVFNLGFRSLRAFVFDSSGRVIFRASRSVETIQFSDGVEQDPLELISKVENLLETIAEHPIIYKHIKFITFSGSSTCLVTTDSFGNPIGNCLLVADRRASEEAEEIGGMPEFEKLKLPGRQQCDGTQMLPKILWAKRNSVLAGRKTLFLSLNDFFCQYLTGNAFTDTCNATKLYYDPITRSYPLTLLEKLGISVDELPVVVEPGTTVAPIRMALRERFHIASDCQYIVTSYDAICGFWGSNPVDQDACDVSGTVTSLRTLVRPRAYDSFSQNLFYQAIDEKSGILGGSNNLGGGLIEWAKDLLFKEDPEPYQALELQARDSGPGARGLIFLPYMLGERAPLWNPNARGVFLGIERFHHRGDFARAILESAGYALLDLLKEIETCGYPINAIRSSGGMSRLRFASELKADITGKQILVLDDFESTSVGAFIFMAKATNLFPSLEVAAKSLVSPKEIIEPNISNHTTYSKIHELYKDAYQSLIPFFERRHHLFKGLYQDKIHEALSL